MTTVINIHDAPAGWQDDPRYVYIGRANKHYGLPKSVWANPYRIGTDGNRDEVIQRYRDYLLLNPKLQSLLPTLANKTLVCYCSPEACHGDVIVESMSVTAPTHTTNQTGETNMNRNAYIFEFANTLQLFIRIAGDDAISVGFFNDDPRPARITNTRLARADVAPVALTDAQAAQIVQWKQQAEREAIAAELDTVVQALEPERYARLEAALQANDCASTAIERAWDMGL